MNTSTALVLLAAVVAGWVVQLYMTYQQSMAFNRSVTALRKDGTVSVGVAGRRYRGGRAFVAIAVDDHGKVANAISLSGWTTFARSRPVPGLRGAKVNQVKGDKEFTGLTRQQRDAAREAATLLKNQTAAPA